jgi:histone deacetylase complex regulatory component SIN3
MTLTSTNNSTIVSRRHSNNQTLPNESSRSMTSTSTTNTSTHGTMAEATGAAAAAAIPEEQTDSSTDQTVTRPGTRRAQDKQQVCRQKI